MHVGDLVSITRLGKTRVYGISAILTGNRETRILAECVSDPSIFASFSWRDHATVGVEAVRPATEAEILKAIPKPKAPRKPATRSGRKAKAVAAVRARKGNASASVVKTARKRIAKVADRATASA